MKIAICSVQEFNPTIGGIERVSVSIGTELVKKGVEVIFISCQKSAYSKEYNLPAPQYFLPDAKDYSEVNVFRFIEIIKKEHVDLILNQNAHSYLYNKLCYEVKKQTQIPLVSEFHFCPDMRVRSKHNMIDWHFFSFKENMINLAYDIATRWPFTLISMKDQRKLFQQMYEVSDKVVLLSKNYYNSFVQIGNLKEKSKLCAISNILSFLYSEGVDLDTKKKELVFVGRFNPQKNPYRPLYIWEKLQNLLPEWKMIMAGNGPWLDRVVKLSKKMGLRNIEFKGFVNPINLYKEGSVFIMTSNYEGFGLVLTEAMQYGCVPVAFNSFGSITDIISDREDGILVEPFDITDFAKKIYDLINSGKLNDFALKANHSVSRFRPEIIIDQWTDLFDELINKV